MAGGSEWPRSRKEYGKKEIGNGRPWFSISVCDPRFGSYRRISK